MRQEHIRGAWCPACRAWLDAVTTDEDCSPAPGAVAVCWECGEISLFDEELQLRKPTVAEFRGMQRSSEWLKIQLWARGIRRRRKEKAPPFGARPLTDVRKS